MSTAVFDDIRWALRYARHRPLFALAVTVTLSVTIAAPSTAFGLVDVSPTDPVTLLAVAAVLLTVATGAAIIPARRAARVDPIVALRSE